MKTLKTSDGNKEHNKTTVDEGDVMFVYLAKSDESLSHSVVRSQQKEIL